MEITFCTIAEFPLQVALIDGNLGCDEYQIIQLETGYFMEEVCLTQEFAPGTYWFWVGPSVYSEWSCGALYVATIEGYTGRSTPPIRASWGEVKTRFGQD